LTGDETFAKPLVVAAVYDRRFPAFLITFWRSQSAATVVFKGFGAGWLHLRRLEKLRPLLDFFHGRCEAGNWEAEVCITGRRELSGLNDAGWRELSGRADAGRRESGRAAGGRLLLKDRDAGGRAANALRSVAARQKSTCFLNESTFATCTVSLSPNWITRRVRRPTRLRRASSNT
jgi:hypothetical protein